MASMMSKTTSSGAPARDDDAEEEDICSICLEGVPRWGAIRVRYSCCGTIMHKECDSQFMRSGCDENCPMCRAPFPSAEQQHARALHWARKGKAWAMSFVATDFCEGRGVSASKEMARLWSEKAAEQGDCDAQAMLGYMHYDGEGGLPVSKEKALFWIKRAAEQGLEEATTFLQTELKAKCFSCGKPGSMSCCARCTLRVERALRR